MTRAGCPAGSGMIREKKNETKKGRQNPGGDAAREKIRMKKQEEKITQSPWLAMALYIALVSGLAGNCAGDDKTGATADINGFLETYSEIAYRTYGDSVTTAKGFQTELNNGLATEQTEANLAALKTAWLDMRVPFLQTEAFRFSETPIDSPNYFAVSEEIEGDLNAWPLDEVYLDNYLTSSEPVTVEGLSAASFGDAVNGPDGDEEKNITIGYHAIEYLLWGQDLDENGDPILGGQGNDVSPSDFSGTDNRRLTALQSMTTILIQHLSLLRDAWAPEAVDGVPHFREGFVAGGAESVQKVLTGLATFANAEWGGERLVGLTVFDQEEEHSCFSDNTWNDFKYDAVGVQNIYLGAYGDYQGVGLTDLNTDSDLDRQVKTDLNEIIEAFNPANRDYDFDELIEGGDHEDLPEVNATRVKIIGLADSFIQLGSDLEVGDITKEAE